MKSLARLFACFILLSWSISSNAADLPGGIPAVIIAGSSIGSGQWPVLRLRTGLTSPLSETGSLAGYFDLSTALMERTQGKLHVINIARAGTTSYDLPNGWYDAVGDSSVPAWPGLKKQFERGYQHSMVPDGTALKATATHLFISLPDDCYYAVDYAVPGCVNRMIDYTEKAVLAARAKGLVVIVQLQNDPENLNIDDVPELITPDQYKTLADAWKRKFSGRESNKIFTINLYKEANVDPQADLLDGTLHLNHGAMIRAADQLLALISATMP